MAGEYHLLKRKGKDKRSGKPIQTYHIGFLNPDGKGYAKMKSTGIKVGTKEAERVAAKYAEKLLNDGFVSTNRLNLRTFLLDFWTPEKSQYLQSKTVERDLAYSNNYCLSNRLRIEDYFLPYFEAKGVTTIDQLNHKNLLEWRNDLAMDKIQPGKNRGHSKRKHKTMIAPSSKNDVRKAVWVALNWAVEMGDLPAHPGARVKKIPERKQKMLAEEKRAANLLELDEAKILFKYENWVDKKYDDFIAYGAALYCFNFGARLGEARGLQFEYIDLENKSNDIIQSFNNLDGMKPPKWEKSRKNLPLSDELIAAILQIIRNYPYDNPGPQDFVFPNSRTRTNPVTAHYLNKALRRAVDKAGITKDITFQDLRHAFISHAQDELPGKVVRSIVGHSSPQITQRVYTHETERNREELNNFITKILGE